MASAYPVERSSLGARAGAAALVALRAGAPLVAFAVPFGAAVWRASAIEQWAADAWLANAIPGRMGLQGVISTLLIHGALALPIGSCVLRAACVSAVALGVFGSVVLALTRRLVSATTSERPVGLLLALFAALAATLPATPLAHATAIGGGLVAASVALLALLISERLVSDSPTQQPPAQDPRKDQQRGQPAQDPRRDQQRGHRSRSKRSSAVPNDAVWLLLGGLCVAAALEDIAVGATVVLVVALRLAVWGPAPTRRSVGMSMLGAGVVAALLLVPLLAHMLGAPGALPSAGAGIGGLVVGAESRLGAAAAGASASLGASMSSGTSLAASTRVGAWGAAGAFRANLGVVPLVLAVLGLAASIAARRARPLAISVCAMVAGDLALARVSGWRGPEARMALPAAVFHIAAFGALALGSGIAMCRVAAWIVRVRLPASRSALTFLAMFDLAVVAASAEEAAFAAAPGDGAERFVAEAFERLPPFSVLFVRSAGLHARLAAARATMGVRPDVTIVPHPSMTTVQATIQLLEENRYLTDVLRDVSIETRPLERSLTALADRRPVFVELDPAWDRRIISHLVPEHLWLRFAPEPRGPSDRRGGFASARLRAEAMLQGSKTADAYDPATVTSVLVPLKGYAAVAAELGDRDELRELIVWMERWARGDRFLLELARRAAASRSGPVDTRALWR